MKLVRIFSTLFTIAISMATIASALSGYVDPSNWWFISITGLVFIPLVFLNAMVFMAWLFIDRKASIIPLTALLISLIKLPLVAQFGGKDGPLEKGIDNPNQLKVVSFNVRLFDLYNWSNSEKTRQEIFQLIKEMDPDVVCFQEFFDSKSRGLDNIHDIKLLLDMPYHHTAYSITKFTSDHYGIATFSKYPILKKEVITNSKKSTNLSIFSDIKVGADTIKVINCHLQSIRFNANDYAFLEDPTNASTPKHQISKTFNILKRMKKAYSFRSEQAKKISEVIKNSNHKIIVCGDFNDTPLSYTYQTISDQLNDSFTFGGKGTGQTYAGPLPGLRIDYILYDDHFSIKHFKTHNHKKLSDHYPLEAVLEIRP